MYLRMYASMHVRMHECMYNFTSQCVLRYMYVRNMYTYLYYLVGDYNVHMYIQYRVRVAVILSYNLKLIVS